MILANAILVGIAEILDRDDYEGDDREKEINERGRTEIPKVVGVFIHILRHNRRKRGKRKDYNYTKYNIFLEER